MAERKLNDIVVATVSGLGIVGREETYVKFFTREEDVSGLLGKPNEVLILSQLYGGNLLGVSLTLRYTGKKTINGVDYNQWIRVA